MKTFTEYLSESSLSRVYHHIKSEIPLVVMTAFRGNFTYKENVSRNKQLASMVKRTGYGYFYVDGHWVEKDGNNSDDTSEDSIFIIGNENDNGKLLKLATQWMKKYNQDSVVFKPENSEKIVLLYQDGKKVDIGKFSPDKVAQAYTRLRGKGERTFVFESAWIEKNWIGKLAELKSKE